MSTTHRIYVASSWRNTIHPSVVAALRKDGHDVYDFKNPAPGDTASRGARSVTGRSGTGPTSRRTCSITRSPRTGYSVLFGRLE